MGRGCRWGCRRRVGKTDSSQRHYLELPMRSRVRDSQSSLSGSNSTVAPPDCYATSPSGSASGECIAVKCTVEPEGYYLEEKD